MYQIKKKLYSGKKLYTCVRNTVAKSLNNNLKFYYIN